MLGTILLVLSISTYFMHKQATRSLVDEHINKLISLKSALKVYIEDYFVTTQNIVITLSDSQTTINAIQQFEVVFNEDTGDLDVDYDQSLLKNKLTSFLEDVAYDVPHAQDPQPLEHYFPGTENGKRLQELYIVNNPFRNDQRYKLVDAKSDIGYNMVHKEFHPYFLKELKKYHFYDLFLIDNAGNIIYSVYKEFDFATNVVKGAYAKSGLASVFKRAVNLPQGVVAFEDFKPYEASYNKPAAFVATPIYNNDVQIGILVIQLPINQLVKVMSLNNTQSKIGLGKSGESFLVGEDFYMRSDSRFIHLMTNPLVERFATTVGLIKVKTKAAIQALKGVTADELAEDYRGVAVYSSYAPIKVFDAN